MSNLLAHPRNWKAKAVILNDETAYGIDANPTGAAHYIEARNVSLTAFDGETVDRNIETAALGNGGKLIVGAWAKLSFDAALAGSGAGGSAPKWGPLLLGCGFAETVSAGSLVTYSLVSTGFSSLTAYLNIDGSLYKFIGSRGEAKFKINAKGIPLLSVELTALYTAPLDGAMPTLTKTGWLVEEGVNSVNTGQVTLNGIDLAFSTLEFSLGNKITRLDLPGPQREVLIIDRAPTATLTVLAPALAVFNPYTLAANNTAVTLRNVHGTAAGKKVQTDLKGVIVGIAEDQIEGLAAYKLTIEPLPVSGNDEITITVL